MKIKVTSYRSAGLAAALAIALLLFLLTGKWYPGDPALPEGEDLSFHEQDKEHFSCENYYHDLDIDIMSGKMNVRPYTRGHWSCAYTLDDVIMNNEPLLSGAVSQSEKVDQAVRFYRGSKLIEEYINTEHGMRQNFIIADGPEGKLDVMIRLKLRTDLLPVMTSKNDLWLFNPFTRERLVSYMDLKTFDDRGMTYPSEMRIEHTGEYGEFDVELWVSAEDVTYPLTIDPLVAAAWSASGGQDTMSLGFAVAGGCDVNSDGRSDVIVGAPHYDRIINTPNGDSVLVSAGQVLVYLGGPTGLALAPQFTLVGRHAGDQLGFSVDCAGDVNNDGYDDIVIGSPTWEDSLTIADFTEGNTDRDEGAFFIYYGSMSGITGSDPDTITGQLDTMQLGYSVAGAGDVNGDGFSDVIIGANKYANGQVNEGAVYIYQGNGTGIDPVPLWFREGDQAEGFYGSSVSGAGDVNNDGLDDIIIGAYGQYNATDTAQGKAFIHHGVSGAAPLMSASSQYLGPHKGARLGIAVSGGGDVNGDDFDDVIIGADRFLEPFKDTLIITGQGKVFVYHGSPSGASVNPDFQFEGISIQTAFGSAVSAAGDVNSDGYDDILVGAPSYTGPEFVEGRAYAFYGSPGGLLAVDWQVESDEEGSNFGYALAGAGDINEDGYDDIIVGAPNFSGNFFQEGTSYVFFGDACGLPRYGADPVFVSFPADITVSADRGQCSKVVDFDLPTFDDNCPGAALTRISGMDPGASFPVGTTEVTYRVTNVAGNSIERSLQVTVTDDQDPYPVDCNGTLVFSAGLGNLTAMVNYPMPTFDDNCGVGGLTVARVSGPASGTNLGLGVYEVVYKAVDENENETMCTFRIVVLDSNSPTTTCNSVELISKKRELVPIVQENKRFEPATNSLSDNIFGGSRLGSNIVFQMIEGALGIDIPDWIEKLLGVGGGGIDLAFVSFNWGITPGINMEYGIYNELIGADSATFDINYLAKVCVGHPEAEYFGCNDTVTITTSTELLPNSMLTVDPGVLQQEIGAFARDLRAELSFYISASACIGIPNPVPIGPDCLGYEASYSITPTLFSKNIWDGTEVPVVVTCDDLFDPSVGYGDLLTCATDLGVAGSIIEDVINIIDAPISDGIGYEDDIDAVVIGLPALLTDNIPVPLPEFDFTFGRLNGMDLGGTNYFGDVISVVGIEPTFTKFRFDLISLIDLAIYAVSGGASELPPCVGLGTTISLGCGLIMLDIGDVNANFNSRLTGRFSFDPDLSIGGIDLGVPQNGDPNSWKWMIVEQNLSGTGRFIPPFEAGQMIKLVIPEGQTEEMEIANNYDLEGMVNVLTQRTLTLDFGAKLYEFGGTLFGGDNLFALLCLDPIPGTTIKLNTPTTLQNASFPLNFPSLNGQWLLNPDDSTPVVFCRDTMVTLNEDGMAFIDAETAFDATNSYDRPVGGSGMINIVDVYPDTIFCDSWPGVSGYLVTEDDNCNFDTCQFWITIQDTIRPQIGCQDIAVQIGENGLYHLTPEEVLIGATDNCRDLIAEVVPNTLNCSDIGTQVLVMASVTDIAGNSNECEARVTVLDTSIFVLECPFLENYPAYRTMDPGLCYYIANASEFLPSLRAPDCFTSISFELSGATEQVGQSNVGGIAFNQGTTTVTYTATDGSGNMQQCIFEVIVEDQQKPAVPCPQNIVISTDHDALSDYNCSTQYAWDHPLATDNCAQLRFYEVRYTHPNGTVDRDTLTSRLIQNDLGEVRVFEKGLTSITYYAQDSVANDSSCTFTIEVVDDESPEILCDALMTPSPRGIPAVPDKEDIPVLAGAIQENGINRLQFVADPMTCSFVMTDTLLDPPMVDNCSDPLKRHDYIRGPFDHTLQGAEFPVGETWITWVATDGSGNTDSCMIVVEIIDDLPPEFLNCPRADVVENAETGECQAYVNFSIPIALDNCGNVSVRQIDTTELTTGDIFPVGLTVMEWEAIDSSGNTARCQIRVIVNDTQRPVIPCPKNILISTDHDGQDDFNCSTYYNWTHPLAMDNCNSLSFYEVSYTGPSGTVSRDTLTDRWRANDLDESRLFPQGVTTLTYFAIDTMDNDSVCSFTIEVIDDEKPRIQCDELEPVYQIGTNHDGLEDNNCSTAFSWTHATALENCADLALYEVSYTSPDGQVSTETLTDRWRNGDLRETRIFEKGITLISYYARDLVGNDSICSFAVEVVDDESPVILCEALRIYNSFEWTAGPSPIYPNDITEFEISVPVDMRITDVNLEIKGRHTAFDHSVGIRHNGISVMLVDGQCQGTADLDIRFDDAAPNSVVSAPCDPMGQGGTYQPLETLSAFNGENSEGTWTLFIENNDPLAICGELLSFRLEIEGNNNQGGINRLQVLADPVSCTYKMTDTLFDPPFSDNCPDPFIRHNGIMGPFDHTLQGAVFPLGETEITWVVYDGSGNTDSCVIIVDVLDNQAPEFINCPRADIVENAETGECAAYVNFSVPLAEDNCGSVSVNQIDASGLTSGDVFPVGRTVMEWEAIDSSGNSNRCKVRVIVNDTQDPLLACISDTVVITDPWRCDAIVNELAPVFINDQCRDNVSVFYQVSYPAGTDSVIASGVSDASGLVFPRGSSLVEYRLQDQPGLLITEVTQAMGQLNGGMEDPPYTINTTDDFLEVTHLGPGSLDIGGLVVERSGPNPGESMVIPDGTVMGPGDVLVIHFGNGEDDPGELFFNVRCAVDLSPGTPAAYLISFRGVVIDLVAINGYDPVGVPAMAVISSADWSGAVAGSSGHAGIFRKWTYDNNEAKDFYLVDVCDSLTIGSVNPGFEFMPDNGVVRGLQSILPNSIECAFMVDVEDHENPSCGEWFAERYTYDSGMGGDPIIDGRITRASIFVPDQYDVGEIRIEDLRGTHTELSDLLFKLTSPAGTQVILATGICNGHPGFHFGLDDSLRNIRGANCSELNVGMSFAPEDQLKRFFGESANGEWVLELADTSSGNSGSLFEWTLVIEGIAPYSQQDTLLVNDFGRCGAEFSWQHPRVIDNCCEGDAIVRFITDPGLRPLPERTVRQAGHASEFFEVGNTIVRYVMTDASGNMDSCEFTVTVEDREAPFITNCPGDLTISLDPGDCGVSYYYNYTATDNCGLEAITVRPPNGTFLEIGDTTICVIADDIHGNTDTCKYSIMVEEFFPRNNVLTCNNSVNISLDATCRYEVNADIILEGNDYRCYENYGVSLLELPNRIPHEPVLTIEDIGKCFEVTILDQVSGNSCWGKLCVEDKQAPEIECPDDLTLLCNESIQPDHTGYPVLLSCEASTRITFVDEVLEYTDCADIRLEIYRKWRVEDESGNVTECTQILSVRGFDLADIEWPANFDNIDLPALACYEQRDDAIDISSHILPSPVCVDGDLLDSAYWVATGIRRPVSLGWNDLRTGPFAGHPSPFPDYYAPHPDGSAGGCWEGFTHEKWIGTGVPLINGQSVYTDNAYCSLSVRYQDEAYEICGNSYEILRYWKVRNMCDPVIAGVNPVEYIQVIKVLDTEGPEVVYPEKVTVGMDPWRCLGTWYVPEPWIQDKCQVEFSYVLQSSSGRAFRQADGQWVIQGMRAGVHIVKIIAIDACNRRTVRDVEVTVVDDVPPVALCESHTVVSIPGGQTSGTASTKILANSFDDGSFDNCNAIWFKVVRMEAGSCNQINGDDDPVAAGYQEYPDDEVLFCCEDVGTPVMIRFIVFDTDPGNGAVRDSRLRPGGDLFGHYNECMVEVEVQDKQRPTVVAPPDIVVSCTFSFDIAMLADPDDPTFGRVLTDPALREEVRTEDVVCPQWCEPNPRFGYFPPLGIEDKCAFYDEDHPELTYQHLWGFDGYVSSSCGTLPGIVVNDLRECGQGKITRTITVPAGNNPVTATQTIYFVDCDPYYINDTTCFNLDALDGIVWPCDMKINECDASVDPDITGRPEVLNEDNCSMITIKYEDRVFDVVPDACFKVVRTWIVVDWCHYDPNLSGSSGRWDYVQTISVNDLKEPLLGSCADVTFRDETASFDAISGTCLGRANLVLDSVVDCSAYDELVFEYRIDLFDNGIVEYRSSEYMQVVDLNPFADNERNARDASGRYPLGTHRITWVVEDMCGNMATCTYLFTVEDGKQPTPFCRTGIVTVVMPVSGEVEVRAEDLDVGSLDNCPGDLEFHFDSAGVLSSLIYDCDDLGLDTVRLWVTDPSGNKDFCITTLEIQDPNEVCGQTIRADIAGLIEDGKEEFVENAIVTLYDNGHQAMQDVRTDALGKYSFQQLPIDQEYIVKPERNDDPLNGVSTRDLIFIQRHILGIQPFGDPLKMIAADINNSGAITAKDLVELRKMILGIYQDFREVNDEQRSWRFVRSAFVFTDTLDPYGFDESILFDPFSAEVKNADFTAVKIGDVDGNARANSLLPSEKRSPRVLDLVCDDLLADPGAVVVLPISSPSFSAITGMQFTLQFDPDRVEFAGFHGGLLPIYRNNYNMANAGEGLVTFSWNSETPVSADMEEILFTIEIKTKEATRTKGLLNIGSTLTAAEAYRGSSYEVWEPMLKDKSANGPEGDIILFQNIPNPFAEETRIGFYLPKDMSVTLSIYGQKGKMLWLREQSGLKGYNEVVLRSDELPSSGVLYYQLDTKEFTAVKRMVFIK